MMKHKMSQSFGHSNIVDQSAQLWMYDRKLGTAKKIYDNTQLIDLHPEFDRKKCKLDYYCANFQFSYDSQWVNFFTEIFYENRQIRDLCKCRPDGSELSIIVSSEDCRRFPGLGPAGRFGEYFYSGSVRNNHQAILPNGKQLLCCTQDPCGLPPGVPPDPEDPFRNTRFLIFCDTDRSRMQILHGDDLNFDGHPTCNPQQTFILGSDYSRFIKIMDPHTAHVTNLFSLDAPAGCDHPHETWSPDGNFIMYRREGKQGELFVADVSDIYK